jgi:hypothetical protein
MTLETEFQPGRLSIPAVVSDDNAGAIYAQIYDNRAKAEQDAWIERMTGGGAAAPAAPSEADKAPASNPDAASVDAMGNPTGEASSAEGQSTISKVAADIGTGVVEAPKQAVGGVIAAVDEFAQFMDSLIPLGGIQITNPKTGEIDLDWLSSEELEAQGGDAIFKAITPAAPTSVTGGFVKATSQFLVSFLPAMRAMKAVKLGQGYAAVTGAGALASGVAFDPFDARLSTYLNQVPALEPVVSDYLADNNPENQSQWEGRLKNVIEGVGLGLATDGLIRSFKYIKAARAEKALRGPDPVGAAVEAGKDAVKDAARSELVQDVADKELSALGNPKGPLLVQGSADETAGAAFQRLADAEKRTAEVKLQKTALAIIENAKKKFAAVGADTVDEMINAVRSGDYGGFDIGSKRPISDQIKAMGGIKPNTSLAAELRARGITAKTFPGLFSNKGRTVKSAQGEYVLEPRAALDNIPMVEHPQFEANGVISEDGYIPQQAWIDALESEMKGKPWRDAEAQAEFETKIAPVDEFSQELDRLGIDVAAMSNAQIKEAIKQIEDEAAILANIESAPLADVGETGVLAPAAPLPDDAGGAAPKGKVFINHARISSSDDVREALQIMADLDVKAITEKARGVVPNSQTIKESAQEYQDLKDLIGRDPGPMSAAQSVAARRLLVSSGEQIVDLAKKAQAASATPADLYNFRRAMAVHYAIQSEVIAARTETARALQAWNIPAGATRARSQAINDLIMRDGGAGDLQQLARAVATVGNNPTALNSMARELGKGRFGKAVYQVWINGLLSGPKTHMVNVLSNAMTAAYAIPERYMAAGISKIFYNGEIDAGEAASAAFGAVKGVRDGIRLIYHGNKAEGMKDIGDVFDAFGKVDVDRTNAISAEAFGLKPEGGIGWGIDMLGKLINLPGAALQAEDKFFKSIGYRMELNALAYRQAASEGLEGQAFASRVADILLDPPENLKADALDVAAYQTFTNPLSSSARQIMGGLAKNPVIGPLQRLVAPFIRTPVNIMKYAFARTPLAYASGAIRADIKAGGARAAQAHGRVALGSMIMLTVADMTAEGTITGRGPLNPDVRRVWLAAGNLPYSVKFGDRRYQFNRLDPIGTIIGMSADIAEIIAHVDQEDADQIVAAGATAFASNLASKTYLSGVFDFISAFDPSNPTNDPGKYLTNLAGSMLPFSSFLRQIEGALDPVANGADNVIRIEEPGSPDDGKVDQVASYIDTLLNQYRKQIPGLSDVLPPSRDLFGKEITTSSGLSWAWDLLSPIASRVDNPDKVIQAIVDNQVAIQRAPRVVDGVRLNGQEYSEFQRLAGEPLKEYLDQLVSSPAWDGQSDGPDGMKAQLIKKAVSDFRRIAKNEMLAKNPRLREISYLNKLRAAQGLQGEN